MIRTIAALSLAFVLGALANATATTTTTVTFDGAWWTGLPQEAKLAAIQGMLVGHDAGWRDAVFYIDRRVSAKNVTSAVRKQVYGLEYATLFAAPPFGDRSFGVMVEKLDAVFVDHPERAKWLVSIYVACAASSGQNCDSLVHGHFVPAPK
jgi:hypothetical protein